MGSLVVIELATAITLRTRGWHDKYLDRFLALG